MSKWTLSDGTDTYTFEVNPIDVTSPPRRKEVDALVTSESVVFERPEAPIRDSFSGTLIDQNQHEKFEEWFDKRGEVTLTDDLGRVFTIILISYEPERRRSISHPWLHDYTLTYWVR